MTNAMRKQITKQIHADSTTTPIVSIHQAKRVSPLTKARNAARLLQMGVELHEVADSFGVSDQTVRNLQTLLALAPAVQDAVESGWLAPTTALLLAPLELECQLEELEALRVAQVALGRVLTGAEVKTRVAARLLKTEPTASELLQKIKALLMGAHDADGLARAAVKILGMFPRAD